MWERVLRSAAVAAALAIVILTSIAPARATVITFDDVGGPAEALVPNGYGGLHWNNFWTIDPGAAGVTPLTSGYFIAATSGKFSAFNSGGDPASISSATPFALITGNFTAAWADGLQLTITGYNGATVLHTLTVTLETTSVLPLVLKWGGLTEVTFSASGGTDIQGYSGRTNFAVDDLHIETPIPGSLLLLITGCGVLGFVGIRRRQWATEASV